MNTMRHQTVRVSFPALPACLGDRSAMSRFLPVLVLGTLFLGIAGCDQRSATPNQSTMHAPAEVAIATQLEALRIADFIDLLTANGLRVGERREKMFQMLMAADGAAFDVDGHTIEVYQFDTSIRTGREALQRLKQDGFMGSAMQIHKNLALAVHGENPDEDTIRRLFESL